MGTKMAAKLTTVAIVPFIWPLIDANISDQLPKLYLFDSLNRTMCAGDMSICIALVPLLTYSEALQIR